MSGNAEIGLDEHPTGAVDGNTQLSTQRRSGNARSPQDDWRWDSFVADQNRAGLNAGDHVGGANLDSQVSQLVFGFAGKFFGIGGQNPGATFDEQYAALPRVDIAKLAVQGVARNFSQGAGEFDSGWSASDDCKLQRRSALAAESLILAFGQLEGEQNAAADFECVFNRLQTG